MEYRFRNRSLCLSRRPAVMGVINLTPDSFYAPSRTRGMDAVLQRAREMLAQGADILDLGGESSRPGSDPVSPQEEMDRVVPAVEAISSRLPALISVDTRHGSVAREALARGAEIVNDISGLGEPGMAQTAAAGNAVVILMHMQGEPSTMQQAPSYQDVLAEVDVFFRERINVALDAGLARDRLWLDPGIGFGKQLEHNLALIQGLDYFLPLTCPIVIGVSRKSFIGLVTGREAEQRLVGTCLYNLVALQQGARILRVHDVAQAVDTVEVFLSLAPGRKPERSG